MLYLRQNPQGTLLPWILIRMWDFPSVFPSSRARSLWLAGWNCEGPSLSLSVTFVLSPRVPSHSCFWGCTLWSEASLWLCLQYEGSVQEMQSYLNGLPLPADVQWKIPVLHSAVCVAFQCQVHTTASDVGSCSWHVCHAVSQQHSPCSSSLPGGQQAAEKVSGVPVHHRREKLPSLGPEATTCFHFVKPSRKAGVR